MTRVALLAVSLAAGIGMTQAQDVPPDQIEPAKATFAKGLEYHVWYVGEQPVQPHPIFSATFGTCFYFPVHYAARPDARLMPFKIRVEVHALNATNSESILFSTTRNEEVKPKAPAGEEPMMFVAAENKLTGEGFAELFLVESETNAAPRRLSNTVRVRLVCPEKK